QLLGRTELRDLLDPEVLAEIESELQWLSDDRRARTAEALADMLRLLGPLRTDEIVPRSVHDADVRGCPAQPPQARRVAQVRMAGREVWCTVEEIARLRDGLGVPVPQGVPVAFTEVQEDPIGDLLSRHARTHGPFDVTEVANRFGLGVAVVRHTLER